MKGCSAKAIKYVEDHGYTFERKNSRGILFYRAPSGHEVGITTGMHEQALRTVMRDVDRASGTGPDLSQKRDVEQIKARQARERILLADEKRRHRERIDALLRDKQQVALGGLGSQLTERQIKDIERLIEDEVRHHREVVRQMTARPAGAA